MPTTLRGSDNFDSANLLGAGQTYQNVTSSRALGTTYNNSTSKPIFVSVSTSNTQGINVTLLGNVNGAVVQGAQGYSASGNLGLVVGFLVPVGATYSVAAVNGTLSLWSELR